MHHPPVGLLLPKDCQANGAISSSVGAACVRETGLAALGDINSGNLAVPGRKRHPPIRCAERANRTGGRRRTQVHRKCALRLKRIDNFKIGLAVCTEIGRKNRWRDAEAAAHREDCLSPASC